MMKSFFLGMYQILYEPFAVGALLAVFCILIFCRKKGNIYLIAASCSVFFMICWRLVCSSLMESSRYSAILIFPSLILVAWLCLKLGVLFRRYFPAQWRGKWISSFSHLLQTIFVIGLMIACIGQILHFTPQANWLPEVVSVYNKEAKPDDILYVQEKRRIAFYAQKNMQELQELPLDDNEPVTTLSLQLQQIKNIPAKHYFFFFKQKNQLEPFAENLNISPADGSWKILARRFTSRRKNKEFILAVFEPACPNLTEWNDKIPALPANDLYKFTGNFETPFTPQQLKGRERYFKQLGIKKYTDLSDRLWPLNWWFDVNIIHKDDPPDIRLKSENPLAGKYSLFIDAANKTANFNAHYLFENCLFTLFIRPEGKEPAKIELILGCKNIKTNKFASLPPLKFHLYPGKIYRIQKSIDLKDFPAGFKNVCPMIKVSGSVTVDQVSVVPTK